MKIFRNNDHILRSTKIHFKQQCALLHNTLCTENLLYLCSVDCVSRCVYFKKNQRDTQFIFNVFHQISLHISDISTAHHQEVHCMDTTVDTYCSF